MHEAHAARAGEEHEVAGPESRPPHGRAVEGLLVGVARDADSESVVDRVGEP